MKTLIIKGVKIKIVPRMSKCLLAESSIPAHRAICPYVRTQVMGMCLAETTAMETCLKKKMKLRQRILTEHRFQYLGRYNGYDQAHRMTSSSDLGYGWGSQQQQEEQETHCFQLVRAKSPPPRCSQTKSKSKYQIIAHKY